MLTAKRIIGYSIITACVLFVIYAYLSRKHIDYWGVALVVLLTGWLFVPEKSNEETKSKPLRPWVIVLVVTLFIVGAIIGYRATQH